MPRNTLMDLNNHLFAELERLGDEDLTQEELEKEIARADAITKVGNVLVNNAQRQHWKQRRHRWNGEEANGPIPKDYTVTFLDKNKENLELSNLALLSRRAQLVAQHHYGLSEDQEISKSVIQLSELQVKRNSLHKRLKEDNK